jgi:hypothetical protein
LDTVFPHLKAAQAERVFVESGTVHVTARTPDNRAVHCPGSGVAAHRFHGGGTSPIPLSPVVRWSSTHWCAVSSAISQHARAVTSLGRSKA